MPADTFLWLLTQALFMGVFVAVGFRALRHPEAARADVALLFGIISAVLVLSDVGQLEPLRSAAWLTPTLFALVSALPFVMLRLVDDFAPQPPELVAAAAALTFGLIVAPFLVPQPWPVWLQAAPEVWFVGLGGYASAAFLGGSMRARGVTARRMLAIAIGSGLLALVLLLSLLDLLLTLPEPATPIVIRLSALGAGVAYLLGFSPPAILRQAWQVPELRRFLERAVELPRLPDTASTVAALEAGAAASTGATAAVIGLWQPERRTLIYRQANGDLLETREDEFIGGMAFSRGRSLFVANAAADDPGHAERYRQSGARVVLAAPISAGERRLGVLTVFAPRAPIFAEDDLRLVELLADQAAVILESRALIADAARVAAREETTRLKDDFLSAAAHDLRTPLTTLLLHAELLQRETARTGGPSASSRVDRIVTEAKRLRELVTELLDGMEAERGHMVLHRQPTDLVALAAELCADRATPSHSLRLETDGDISAEVDPNRVRQLLENLLDNAMKYSPDGGDVIVRVRADDGSALLSVTDSGIGIPASDLPHLFDRFHRGSNVDDRRYHGLGLGLYICRGIVEQHGGTISATSEPGSGTQFVVALPLVAPAQPEEPAPATTAPAVATTSAEPAPLDIPPPSTEGLGSRADA